MGGQGGGGGGPAEGLLRGSDGGAGDRVRVPEQAGAAQVGAGHHRDAQPPRQLEHEHHPPCTLN